jgi:hypothetical protein
MHCKTCAFFNDQGSECRRYAPQPHETDRGDMKASWPNVSASDWCGEYKPDEDKASRVA